MSSMEVVKRIKEAEKQAEGIKQEALQEARDIMIKAQDEADSLAQKMHQDALQRRDNLMAETEAQANKEIGSLEQKNGAKISALRGKAEKNLHGAVSFVLGRVVRDYGRN